MRKVNSEKLLSMVEQFETKKAQLIADSVGRVEELVQEELEKITPDIRQKMTEYVSAEIEKAMLSEKAAIIDECIEDVPEEFAVPDINVETATDSEPAEKEEIY